MPAKAVRPQEPPVELRDRVYGWGFFGRIYEYPDYQDKGSEWPATVEVREEPYPSEMSDQRDNGWWTADELDAEQIVPGN